MNDRNSIPNSSGPTTQPLGKSRGRWQGCLFRLGAVLVGIVPFLLLESSLRLFDVGRPKKRSDPLAGFNRNFPLFERHGSIYRTALARQPFFPAQEFPAEKPRNGFRMFCFGGSTVHGHPYQSETAFPKWLEIELAGGNPARAYQAVNCGGVSYASYRLAPIVKEVLSYQPDLVIVATGENEFLEDRTYQSIKSRSAAWAWVEDAVYSLRMVTVARNWIHDSPRAAGSAATGKGGQVQLSQEVQPRLDESSGYASYHRDDAWRDRVAAQFEESVRTMVEICRKAGVPILLLKLGSNLRDCPPFKSEHRPDLSPEQESVWETAFEAATAAEDRDLESALALYRKAEALDGEYALLAYRVAHVLDRLGRKSEALEYYLKARDQDICPLRITKQHEAILETIAAETGTPLVDAASLLAARSPDGIPGNNWYLDHVHPSIGGTQKIAQTIAMRIRELGIIPNGAPWPEEKRREAYARQLDQLGARYFPDGKRRVVWLENWARRERLFDETLPTDARGYLHSGFRQLDLGDEDGAWEAFGEALKRDGGTVGLLREHAQELLAQGRPESSKKLLRHLDDTISAGRLPGK